MSDLLSRGVTFFGATGAPPEPSGLLDCVSWSMSSERHARVEEKGLLELVVVVDARCAAAAILCVLGALLHARAHSLRDCTAATMAVDGGRMQYKKN